MSVHIFPVRGSIRSATWIALAFLVGVIPMVARADGPTFRPTALDAEAPFRRFLWVTRWDYSTPKDIERICYNAASARITDILFQVRGEATVFFKSPYEPWAWELSGRGVSGTGRDPGWDPLAEAIREGRRRGLRVHAYLNVLPAWAQSESPPKSAGHVYTAHRSWLMADSDGATMTPGNFYAFLDPGIPEVREHLVKLFSRLVKDYDVDGVHLDYIRYPHERGDFSYHARVVKDFRAIYGRNPYQAPEEWAAFRRRQVTDTVAAIRKGINETRPGIELSAAVMANTRIGRTQAYQEPIVWLQKGYVDAVTPMTYVEDMPKFRELSASFSDPNVRSRVWPGIRSIEKNHVMSQEIKYSVNSGFPGVAIFCYTDLFPDHRAGSRAKELYAAFKSAAPKTQVPRPSNDETKIAAPGPARPRNDETQIVAASGANVAPDAPVSPAQKIKRRLTGLKVKLSE